MSLYVNILLYVHLWCIIDAINERKIMYNLRTQVT
jgi:hypothetical protein